MNDMSSPHLVTPTHGGRHVDLDKRQRVANSPARVIPLPQLTSAPANRSRAGGCGQREVTGGGAGLGIGDPSE